MSKKIAVVGAGLSGLAAAWMLHASGFEVIVFEASGAVGGQVETFAATSEGRPVRFDAYMGNLILSYNLLATCELFGIPVTTQPFGFAYENGRANWTNYASNDFSQQYSAECRRFLGLMRDLYDSNSTVEASAVSLLDFLRNHQFADEFAQHVLAPFLTPMIGAQYDRLGLLATSSVVELFGTAAATVLEPTMLYQFGNSLHDFLQQLSLPLQNCIAYNRPVRTIRRTDSGVFIQDSHGVSESFDEVILACNFQQNLALLGDSTTVETNIFQSVEYKQVYLSIHTDTSVAPDGFPDDPHLECLVNANGITTHVYAHGSQRQRIPGIFATSSTDASCLPDIDRSKILHERWYCEELLTLNTVQAKGLVHHIQGQRHTWYCGLSTTSALAESVFVSGLVVASQLGARYPFADHPEAARVFSNIQQLMFTGHPSLRLLS